MFPPAPGSSPAAASLPPLPDLSGGGSEGAASGPQDSLAALMSGLAPVKAGVNQIIAGARAIVQSGAVPGAEQPCAQIIALATSLLPMAVQSGLNPGGQATGPVQPMAQGPQPVPGV